MAILFWSIEWDLGAYPINGNIEKKIVQAIRKRIEGRRISPDAIGRYLSHVEIVVGNTTTSFTARLDRIDPPVTFTVDHATSMEVYLMTDHDNRGFFPNGDTGPSLARDLEEMIMFQTIFDPSSPSLSFYLDIYESLVGIPKESILNELLALMMPMKEKERWSRKHYGMLLPLLRIIINKAPAIVMGGDPGTGKTALATSIGAPLSKKMGERVHFRHLSLMLRGMGYQGRASGMIVKLFEQIKREYIELGEPMILFFDEAEAVVGTRQDMDSSSGAQENVAVVDAIIVGVDSLKKGLQARIAALFATNLTSRIDSALMRRSYYHYFNRPDTRSRYELFARALRGMNFSKSDIAKLVEATMPRKSSDGIEVRFTHSDIVELIIGQALDEAILQDKPVDMALLLKYCLEVNPTGLTENQHTTQQSKMNKAKQLWRASAIPPRRRKHR